MPRRSVWISLVLLISLEFTARADIAVVVHLRSPQENISLEDLKDIFLGKKLVWPGGNYVEAVDLKTLRQTFIEQVFRQKVTHLNRYWLFRSLAGRGLPPAVLRTPQEVKEFVALHPGGIGYLNIEDVDESVKVLLIIKIKWGLLKSRGFSPIRLKPIWPAYRPVLRI